MAATHVQSKSSLVSAQNQTQIKATFDSAVTLDNWIYVFVFWQDTAAAGAMSQTVSSVTGGTGNTYTNLTQWQNTSNTARCQIWKVKNQHNAAHEVTVNFSAAVGNRISLDIIEVSGVHATNAPIEQDSIGQITSGSSLNAANVTSLDENSLSITAVHTFSSPRTFSAPSVGFTIGTTATNQGAIAYCVQPTIGTYGATWSWTGGNSTAIALHLIVRPTTVPSSPPTTGTPTTLMPRDIELNRGLN